MNLFFIKHNIISIKPISPPSLVAIPVIKMAEKFRKFASAAAAMAVTLSRPDYFESGKKGKA